MYTKFCLGVREFVEEEELALGKSAQRAQRKAKIADIRDAIDEAYVKAFFHICALKETLTFKREEMRDDSSDSSDASMISWEQKQIRKGTFAPPPALKQTSNREVSHHHREDPRLEPPLHFSAILDMATVMERLRDRVKEKEERRNKLQTQYEDLEAELEEIGRREAEVKEGLEKANEEFAKFQNETKYRMTSAIETPSGSETPEISMT